MKILVTGANGQLGSEINIISSHYNFEWIFLDRKSFDLSDLNNINIKLNRIKPNVIINCAAYTSVNDAEDDFESANIINHMSVNLIAKWCNFNNCKLLHISTDYVYDGSSKIPICEDSPTNPINNYGKTKLLGDLTCLKYNPSSIIIRTSWLYSSFGNNFVKKMIFLMHENKELDVINDQIGSPTYAADLSELVISIIINKQWRPGIYNYTNNAKISWYDLANDIKGIYGFNTTINGVSSKKYSGIAKRPKYSLLDKTKIKTTFNITLIPYKDSLKKCIKILKNET
jgi:dTDP-4-dehydrorhamnose reductase